MNMEKLPIKIYSLREGQIPSYSKAGDAGCDLRAYLPDGPVTLKPFERALIPTGIHIQLVPGYEAQVRPRSGLALKHGISVLNTPGTIDSGFTNQIGVILINMSNEDFVVNDRERIAQLVIAKHETAEFIPVQSLDEFEKTERGMGGFGHTGTD